MTKGELRFYLREIHPYWTTPRISEDKVAELEREKLIERSTAPVAGVRLTREGEKEKSKARLTNSNSTLNLTRTPKRPPQRQKRRQLQTRRAF